LTPETILNALDLFGIIVFAISGALAAGEKQMDIFGVVVLAMVTALGGGTLRDLLLDSGPVFWVANHRYIVVVTLASVLTFFMVRWVPIPHRFLLFADAFGLALFTAIGTAKALAITQSGVLSIIMGVMTGVVGGMIRDIVCNQVPLVLRKDIYATAALLGSGLYLLMDYAGFGSNHALVVSTTGALLLRLAVIKWKLTLPDFISKPHFKK